MTEYAIKAYPTEYRGRTYRSRLEARWAAFFDLLGWKHEYEPFDLGKWSPDFLLTDMNVLVEVKPITDYCGDRLEKMLEACDERGLLRDTKGRDGITSLLLLGVAPQIYHGNSGSAVYVGWFAPRPHFIPIRGCMGWIAEQSKPEFIPDVFYSEPAGWFTASGNAGTWEDGLVPRPYVDHTMALWAKATGLVQWRSA